MKSIMHTSFEPSPRSRADFNWVPSITLGFAHFLIAFACGLMALFNVINPMLAVVCMAFFGAIAMVFVLLTITRLR